MSDQLPSSTDVFESQKESLADAWNDDYRSEKEQFAVKYVMVNNLLKLAYRAALEQDSDISE